MLDFTPLKNKEVTLSEFTADLTPADLHRLTNEMVDHMLDLIADCLDDDVTFMPIDPAARDPFAATEAEQFVAWTLGHVIVHATASAEESAFLAAELARGVQRDGRSRSELPWQTITTIAQCRGRLQESRRMRLASLGIWPDALYLDMSQGPRPMNAIGRFILGLRHDSDHLGQIAEIVRQAKAARS
jgi:hypothetical protein